MKKIVETDLFPPIKNLFESNGFQICSEIEHCDIAAMKGELLVIVEMKTHLSVDLLLQAVKRQRLTENVYIAIPKLKVNLRKFQNIQHLLKRLGLGLIQVDIECNQAIVILEPILFDIAKSISQSKKKKNKLITEFRGRSFDDNIGGSTGIKRMTAYKDQSLFIASCLDLFGPLSPKALKAHGTDFKKTNSILMKNYNGYFLHLSKGLYGLSSEGKLALEKHEEIAKIHEERLLKKHPVDKLKTNK